MSKRATFFLAWSFSDFPSKPVSQHHNDLKSYFNSFYYKEREKSQGTQLGFLFIENSQWFSSSQLLFSCTFHLLLSPYSQTSMLEYSHHLNRQHVQNMSPVIPSSLATGGHWSLCLFDNGHLKTMNSLKVTKVTNFYSHQEFIWYTVLPYLVISAVSSGYTLICSLPQ